MMRVRLAVLLGLVVSAAALVPGADGHGVGYEVLPPVRLGERTVALEVTSSQYEDPDNPDREIQFSLFDTDSTVTIRDVTYHITATKGGAFLFDGTFPASDGIFVFVLEGSDADGIALESRDHSSFFESIVGLKKETVHVTGGPFKTGGLYKFAVEITTAGSFSDVLEQPIRYDVGLSIPERTIFDIEDPNYGAQQISVITYYDEISDFGYDPGPRRISFSMPFEWDEDNINETSVVHEEIALPKTFGDLLVSGYSASVNGVEMPDRAVTVDDFGEERVVHIVLNQNDLRGILKDRGRDDGMRFELAPAGGAPLGTITDNGQYRVAVWEPEHIRPDADTSFLFDITDVFLKDRQVEAGYTLRLILDGDEVARQDGISSDGADRFDVFVPAGVSGVAVLQFENLGGNPLARAELPVIVDRVVSERPVVIPGWIKDNARWWAEGSITDSDFVSGIGFMIRQQIIVVPETDGPRAAGSSIPGWIKDNARWWAEGSITDSDFAGAIQYLVSRGIIPTGA